MIAYLRQLCALLICGVLQGPVQTRIDHHPGLALVGWPAQCLGPCSILTPAHSPSSPVPALSSDSRCPISSSAISWLLQTECLCPPQIQCCNPKAQGDGVRKGAFGRCLGHECGALRIGISALTKETQECLLPLSPPQEGSHLQTKKQALTRHGICHLDQTWGFQPPEL